jgi:hypothetical protein
MAHKTACLHDRLIKRNRWKLEFERRVGKVMRGVNEDGGS